MWQAHARAIAAGVYSKFYEGVQLLGPLTASPAFTPCLASLALHPFAFTPFLTFVCLPQWSHLSFGHSCRLATMTFTTCRGRSLIRGEAPLGQLAVKHTGTHSAIRSYLHAPCLEHMLPSCTYICDGSASCIYALPALAPATQYTLHASPLFATFPTPRPLPGWALHLQAPTVLLSTPYPEPLHAHRSPLFFS